MLHRTAKSLLLLFVLLNTALAASSLPSDFRLIQMVPPDSQVIASVLRPTPGGQPGNLLFVTEYNKIDIEDFFALTGADTSRMIHQVVFVAALGVDGALSEHSLLVSGHFNRNVIFRFAQNGSPITESYRGQAVLLVPPFTRERSRFTQLRWLAILNSDIAIFGTPESVQSELDRQIANSRPDPGLIERLSHLGPRDQTWCLLPAPSVGGAIERVLNNLDPRLAAVAAEGGSMQYGVHFGRRIEITASSNIAVREGASPQTDPSPAAPVFATLAHYRPSDSLQGRDGGTPIVVKISRRRYGQLLEEFSKGNLTFIR